MKYTPEQLANALADDERYRNEGEPLNVRARYLQSALGLEVEDPEPEPGVYLAPIGGEPRPVLVERDGDLWWLNDEGRLVQGMARTVNEVDGLTPARVVPTEPVDVKHFDARRGDDFQEYLSDNEYAESPENKRAFDAGYYAALARYGHGHATPNREDVREAVMRGIGQANGSMTQNITTEVMALLEGGKA